jgi:hypothetical protein
MSLAPHRQAELRRVVFFASGGAEQDLFVCHSSYLVEISQSGFKELTGRWILFLAGNEHVGVMNSQPI